jgi:hypothetical protein
LPPKTELGAIEFGSGFLGTPPALSIFKPEPVGPNAAAMKAALATAIQGDDGATDYNAAFALADAEDPVAQARIFLTDGGHNEGEYANGHLTHNVPTYVVGFGSGLGEVEDQARLQRIATETGGQYFLLSDSSQLQSVMNAIGAAITCQTPPQSFTDKLKEGEAKPHAIAIGGSTKSIQIALTWASPLDKFKLIGLQLVKNGKPIAVALRPQHKPRKLGVKVTTSKTFALVKVSGLGKGKLRFKVQAAKIGSGEPQVSLTTQVTQVARR